MSSPSSASSPDACTSCGKNLPAGYPPGLCPLCLMDVAMHPTQDDTLPVRAPQPLLSAEDLAPHFPQLEILGCIGRGGMGVVYQARQKALDRLVALKLLAPEQEKDAAFSARFAHEARALAALNHPNIVTVHDFGESGGFYYLLMEFVDGVNLRQAMQGSHLSPEQALAIVPPICEALQYAHEHGIVHRDIKPENLLMDKTGRVKIADFGIAKMVGRAETESPGGVTEGPRSTLIAGTPHYMAPEQRSADARADHRADIYSLGVVLYELLTGELPAAQLPPLSQRGTMDARLDEIVARALQQSPENRYQTIAEMRTHLATLSSAPREDKVHSRDKYERWFATLLRTAGWCCVLAAIHALLEPVVDFRRLSFRGRPWWVRAEYGVVPMFCFLLVAWLFTRRPYGFVRASYRPMIRPSRRGVEIAGIITRTAGLFLIGLGLNIGLMEILPPMIEPLLRDSRTFADGWQRVRYDHVFECPFFIGCGVVLFFFEYTLIPFLYAIPAWRPLPYAIQFGAEGRRRLSGHALAGGAVFVFHLYLFITCVRGIMDRISESSEISTNFISNFVVWFVIMAFIATIASALGWAAINLIRAPQSGLRGLRVAILAALTLPLHLSSVVITFLVYGFLRRLQGLPARMNDGSVQLPEPDMGHVGIGISGLMSLLAVGLWLVCWRRFRKVPVNPPPLIQRSQRPIILRLTFVGGVVAAMIVGFYLMTTQPVPPPIWVPEDQFSRLVERQIHLEIMAAGFSHQASLGSLKLPPIDASTHFVPSHLKDRAGSEVRGSLSLKREPNAVMIQGSSALSRIRCRVTQKLHLPLRLELTLPSPQSSADCLLSLRRGSIMKAPDALRRKLQAPTPALSAEDLEWLRSRWIDAVYLPQDGGALRLFQGAAAPLPVTFPSGFDWLTLDDHQLGEALKKARASIPASPGSTLVHQRSPDLSAFVTRTASGLLENLGPSQGERPGLRVRLHTFQGTLFATGSPPKITSSSGAPEN